MRSICGRKLPKFAPRRTALLLLFSVLLSVFTVFPSPVLADDGIDPTPPAEAETLLYDNGSDITVTQPETELTMPAQEPEAAVSSVPVITNADHSNIMPASGVDIAVNGTELLRVQTSLSTAESVSFTVDKPNVLSLGNASSMLYGEVYMPVTANQVGVATVTATVNCTNDNDNETVTIELYVTLTDGIYLIKNNETHLEGDYYLRPDKLPTVDVPLQPVYGSTNAYGGLENNLFRYWRIQYYGNGKYAIHSLANEAYALALVNGSVNLSSEISDASLWIIQSHAGSYRIVHGGSNNGNGLVFSIPQSTANIYLGNVYFYGMPTVRDYGDMPFENWRLIPASVSGIVLRNDLYGTLHNKTPATGCVGNAGVTLSDIGYSIVAFESDSDAVEWKTENSAVATVTQNGAMNLLSIGSATIKAAIGNSQYVTLNLSVIAADIKTYFVRNAATGLYADIQNGSMTSGNEVEQQGFDGENTQKWRFYRVIGTAFAIRSNQNISYYLGVENDTATEGADVVLRTGTVTGGMKWRLASGNDEYKLVSCLDPAYVLATVSSGATVGQRLILANYTDDEVYRDEWDLYDIVFSYVNYYDSTFTGSNSYLVNYISDANEFANTVFTRCFGVSFRMDGTATRYYGAAADQCSHGVNVPCTTGCGSSCNIQHHKNARLISNQLYNASRENNHIYVLWSHREMNTYCDGGSNNQHQTVNWIAVVYGKRPVIHFMNIYSTSSNQQEMLEQQQACMTLILAHETAHTFGMNDVYDNAGHDVSGAYVCIMEKFDANCAYDYYIDIKDGYEEPFCASCLATMQELVPQKLHHHN